MYALIDCNNFYASCERLFRPDLRKTPIVVLSNNDGCIVARCQYAKSMGIKMGTPYFKVKDELAHHGVMAFSSNYALYADISQRVMQTIRGLGEWTEVYSIDEAFQKLPENIDYEAYGQLIKETVYRHTGIAVGVGIGKTKTLAKLANYASKKYKGTKGVVALTDQKRIKKLMQITPVEEVWGVGRKLNQSLKLAGINTISDLANQHPAKIRKFYNVVLARTVEELNGQECLELELVADKKKQIISSRSFSHPVTNFDDMRQAIVTYASRASEKLRKEKQLCSLVSISITTSPFRTKDAYYGNSVMGALVSPSSDVRDIVKLAAAQLPRIWKDGHRYVKASVMLTNFCDEKRKQLSLFDESNYTNGRALMKTLDNINLNQKGNLMLASQGMNPTWAMKREYLSPAYTTNWNDLAIICN